MRPYRRRQGIIKALRVLRALSNSEHNYVRDFREGKRFAMKMVNSRHPCSKMYEHNLKKNENLFCHKGSTIREKRSIISFKEYIENLEENKE